LSQDGVFSFSAAGSIVSWSVIAVSRIALRPIASAPPRPARTLKTTIHPTGRTQGNRTRTDPGKQRLCGIRLASTITAGGGYRGFARERYEALRLMFHTLGCAQRICLS
jgi:hypothetical protein